MEGVQEAATAHGGKMQILEGTQCKYPLFSAAAPHAGAAGSPRAGTVTTVALLLQSALLNALY